MHSSFASDGQPILEVRDLHVAFHAPQGVVKAVNGVSLSLHQGRVLGLVGESGSGKTTIALSILRLLPHPGRIETGEVLYQGRDLLKLGEDQMRRVRGKQVALAFQGASSALNPLLPVGYQIREALLAQDHLSRQETDRRLQRLLRVVGLPSDSSILSRYPFQLSGGMAQRAILALALAPDPTVLLADEPTSNLDVTLQAEILDRLKQDQRQEGRSMLFITHDLAVIARMAQQVAVMYAGTIVEEADTPRLFGQPRHPYTWSLFRSLPRLDQPDRPLVPLSGQPPDLVDLPDQCPFLPRCPKATNLCHLSPRPLLQEIEAGHRVACYNPIDGSAA